MVLLVPDEFRNEVLASSEDDLNDLRAAGRALHDRGTDRASVRRKIEEAGWSARFSDWYATRLELDGSDLELRVTRKSRYQEKLEQYEAERRAKRNRMLSGSALVLISILLRVETGMLANATGDSAPFVVLILFLIEVITGFLGLFLVLDSKGQSRWYALIGIFAYLAPDRNRLTPPTKSDGFEKPEVSSLSDW